MLFEELDITDNTYLEFQNTDEIQHFCNSMKAKFKELEDKGYKNIYFYIDSEQSYEYGESYSSIKLKFNYERALTKEELQIMQNEDTKREEDEKIFDELCGKLSTNSIGSIINNEDLRQLYLDGKIKI